jgi:hypothetical protein
MIQLPSRRVGQGKGSDIKTFHFHVPFFPSFNLFRWTTTATTTVDDCEASLRKP